MRTSTDGYKSIKKRFKYFVYTSWEMTELPEIWNELTAGTLKAKAFKKIAE